MLVAMNNKGIAVLSGKWSDNLAWEFYLDNQVPDAPLCTAVYCLAVIENTGELVLTRITRGWEMLGGHIEPGETVQQALMREALEEGGFRPQAIAPFGLTKVTARVPEPNNHHGGHYPQTSYIPYFIAISSQPIQKPTGEEIIESRTFAPDQISALKTNHEPIIRLGLQKYNSGDVIWTKIP